MEKYDVYVWGQVRQFKPLKIEICSNSQKSNYFPQEYKKPLQTIITNRYEWIYNDHNEITFTGEPLKNDHISIWRALKHTYENEVYYPVGDVIFSSKDVSRYGENGLRDRNGKTKYCTGYMSFPRKFKYLIQELNSLFGSKIRF